MSSGRVFQSLGPATANDRSPTVTSCERGMTSSEEVDDSNKHIMKKTLIFISVQ